MTDTTDDRDRNRQPNTAGLAQSLDRSNDDNDVEPPRREAERADSDGSGDSDGDDVAEDDATDDRSAVDSEGRSSSDREGQSPSGNRAEPGDDEADDLPSVPEDGWKAVESPVDVTLLSVEFTAAGPVATGSAGKVLHREPDSGEWRTIIEAGVSVDRNNIHDMDVTDDGERFWFVGDSGIIGAFDVAEGRKYDFSAPLEKTSTWESVGVTGDAGEELVVFANGSGELLPARMDEHGYPEWGTVHKPGRGSTMPGVDFDGQTAYAIDTTGKVYQRDFSDVDLEDEAPGKPGDEENAESADDESGEETSEEPGAENDDESVDESVEESGEEPGEETGEDPDEDSDDAESNDTGLDDAESEDGDPDDRSADDAQGGNAAALDPVDDAADGDWDSPETTTNPVTADPEWVEIGVRNAQVNFHDICCEDGHLLVAGDDGIVYRYDRLAQNWTPVKAGEDAIFAVDQRGDSRIVGTADGHVFEPESMVGWQPRPTETHEDLQGIALGADYDVAVGASGVILERHPDAGEDGDADDGEDGATDADADADADAGESDEAAGEN